MSFPPTAARPASGMAKGAAIAAIVYFGLILLAVEALILLGGTFINTLIRQAEDYSGSASMSTPTGAVIATLAIVVLVVFAFPIGFAVWMLLGAVKDSPVNVLVPLIIVSVFTALSLLVSLGSRQNGGSLVGAGIGLNLPWYAILVFAWVGWARMNVAHRTPGLHSRDLGGYQGFPPPAPGYPSQDPAYPAQPGATPYGAAPPQPAQPTGSYPAQQTWPPAPAQDTGANRAAAGDTTPYEQSEPTRRLPPPEAWPPAIPEQDGNGAGGEPSAPPAATQPVTDPQSIDNEPTVDQRSPWARPDDRADPADPPGSR